MKAARDTFEFETPWGPVFIRLEPFEGTRTGVTPIRAVFFTCEKGYSDTERAERALYVKTKTTGALVAIARYTTGTDTLRNVAKALFTLLAEGAGDLELRTLARFETRDGVVLGFDSEVVY
jgi:hypothetical protein